MADYERLYHMAFNALTDAMRQLVDLTNEIALSQIACERVFIETDEAEYVAGE